MVRKLQNLNDFNPLRFIASDEAVCLKGAQQRIYVRVVAVRKDFGLESERAILNAPLTVGFAPETFEKDREQRVFAA